MPTTASLIQYPTTLAQAHAELLDTCQNYLQAHKASLIEVAGFTAGDTGTRLAHQLCSDIAAADRWHAAFARRLCTLCGLLRLDHLDDPDSPYPVPTEVLDPDPARVTDCCWHVERLEALIARSDAISAHAMRLPRLPVRRPLRSA
ncbi:hypothetical protein [Pararhodobacter sp. SW119]|uniref:hypothetical protein n=1 Tax=Pararhodobacter sp. SW119 TaxID=2780075 RepID=UPI001AE03A33|nr:hypothetical protein [Pararhodobacter sp. SW119]